MSQYLFFPLTCITIIARCTYIRVVFSDVKVLGLLWTFLFLSLEGLVHQKWIVIVYSFLFQSLLLFFLDVGFWYKLCFLLLSLVPMKTTHNLTSIEFIIHVWTWQFLFVNRWWVNCTKLFLLVIESLHVFVNRFWSGIAGSILILWWWGPFDRVLFWFRVFFTSSFQLV